MKPKTRLTLAWILLAGSVVGWPLSAFLWATEEPPFVLGLSWLAIILTALDLVATTDVRDKED